MLSLKNKALLVSVVVALSAAGCAKTDSTTADATCSFAGVDMSCDAVEFGNITMTTNGFGVSAFTYPETDDQEKMLSFASDLALGDCEFQADQYQGVTPSQDLGDDAVLTFTNESVSAELGTRDASPLGADVYHVFIVTSDVFGGTMPILEETFSPETDDTYELTVTSSVTDLEDVTFTSAPWPATITAVQVNGETLPDSAAANYSLSKSGGDSGEGIDITWTAPTDGDTGYVLIELVGEKDSDSYADQIRCVAALDAESITIPTELLDELDNYTTSDGGGIQISTLSFEDAEAGDLHGLSVARQTISTYEASEDDGYTFTLAD